MTTPNRQSVELILSTANTYLQTGNPDRAQELLIRAKLDAEELNLEDLVSSTNRSLAVSHLNQANGLYSAGRLEEADEKYPEAENAYTVFSESFEKPTLLEHLGNLYKSWASSTLQLGQNAHVEGGNQLSLAEGDSEIVLAALGLWDIALQWYDKTIQIYHKAQSSKVAMDNAFEAVPKKETVNIKNAAAQWANSIKRPDIADIYL